MSDKDKASIPIIAMTANAFEEDKRDAIAAGMNGHIAKPIQVDKLLSILSEVIRRQSLYRLKNGTMGKTDGNEGKTVDTSEQKCRAFGYSGNSLAEI